MRAWVGEAADLPAGAAAPAAAQAFATGLRAQGAPAVLVLRVDTGATGLLHWLDTPHARGWLRPAGGDAEALRLDAQATAAGLAVAVDSGFVAADAAILACLHTELPQLSWGETPFFLPLQAGLPSPGLYAIADSAAQLRRVLDAGVDTVQLRIKQAPDADARWWGALRAELAAGIEAAAAAGVPLYINDHWELARALGATHIHLGQEDLQRLGEDGRQALCTAGVALGISSHSVWELCRARALAPRYIACGPVWPTVTKDMPWRPQGEDNLRWWRRFAGTPVVAIGGILGAAEVEQTAAWGADGVCVVRGLGADPSQVVPALRQALERGRRAADGAAPHWPHPSLAPDHLPA